MPPRLLANGASTDHPAPSLPFVDDAHLAAEFTRCPQAARRTLIPDSERGDLIWVVHAHPHLGRSILLYAVDEPGAAPAGQWQADAPLVTRAGGYWWDGSGWYRPPQLWNAAAGDFEQHPVPAAATVTAADLLGVPAADASRGRLLRVADLADQPECGDWLDDLALWAQRRSPADQRPPLERCVVTLTAPELAGDNLVGTGALAALASITPSTLRAYMNRNQGAVPQPQVMIGRRAMWSRPVAQDWVEQRRRPTPDRWASPNGDGTLPPGAEQIRNRLDPLFHAALYEDPARRARWALRYRGPDAVREVAGELARLAATELHSQLPGQDLAHVLVHAALADGTAGERSEALERVLRWLALQDPQAAESAVTAIAARTDAHLGDGGQDFLNRLRTAAGTGRDHHGGRLAAA